MHLKSFLKDCFKEYEEIKEQNDAFKLIKKHLNSTEPLPHGTAFQQTRNHQIVWQFWENPKTANTTGTKLVSQCLTSIDQFIWDGYERKLLDLEISKQYILFPPFVYSKLQASLPGFGLTAFSDILRLALLSSYGGIWLDATMLALRPLKDTYLLNRDSTGFSFKRSGSENFKTRKKWRHYNPGYFSWSYFSRVKWLNSFIVSGRDRDTLNKTLQILLSIWKEESRYPHYFTTQIIHEHLIKKQGFKDFEYLSDVPVHYLQKYAYHKYDENIFQSIKESSPLQKMSWKMPFLNKSGGDRFLNHLLNTGP